MEITKSAWFKIEICVACKTQLGDEDVMYNRGICPSCGNNSGNTMVKVEDIVMRKIYYNHPWWLKLSAMLAGGDLSERIEYEGKDETAKEWLKTNKI